MIVINDATVRDKLPSPGRAVELMRDALRALATGEADTVPKNGVSAGEGRTRTNCMPAAWPERGLLGMKWVALSPANPAHGLPFVRGTMVLTDPDNGATLAILDVEELTALRTAAVTGASLGIDSTEHRRVLFLGTGVQARSHLRVFEALGYEEITVWGRSEDSLTSLSSWAAEHTPTIRVVTTLDKLAATREAEVIVSGLPMKVTGQTLGVADVRPDATLLPLDYSAVVGRELADNAYLVADDPTQFNALRPAAFPEGYPPAQGATGSLLDAPRPQGIVIAQNLGSGLGDVVLAHEVYSACRNG